MGATAEGASTVLHNEFLGTQQQGTEHVFTVEPDAKEVHISRFINGNCASHITLHVPANAQVKIIETITGDGVLASSTAVQVGRDASVQYAILQQLSLESLAFLNYEAKLVHSKLHWSFCGVGADLTQANIATDAGEHSEVINNAVLCGAGKQQFDVHVATKHTGAHSKSDMLTRSVLDDQSRAIYHGLIHIGPDAPECDSYQKDEVILLSERAGADAIPNLEIQNSKVRCSHGATIGKLDAEKLFYFLSRGIDKQQAKRMITEGFLTPLLIAPWHDVIIEKLQS